MSTAIIILSATTISILFGSVASQLMTCPQVCSCIWRNGKQTTICENQNLISIPNQISPSTQVLDLNNNNFQILPSKAFQERGLINLQKLFLPHCKLGAIAEDAFHQLTNLVELDLSDNLLTHVPVKALANATNLRRLLLNNNHIATITAESFAALGNLKFLNLSGCKTHTIEARAFYGLRDLEYLYLHNNQLTTLPYTVVSDLPALYSFELYKNPWQCNCEMRPTREWMIRNNVGQSIPPTCDLPIRLSGLMWNSLDLDDFACEPDIITTSVEITKVMSNNATLYCIVKGLPEPKVFWFTDRGYYNLSANYLQHGNKYHISEERTEGTVNSSLTIINLDMNDDSTSYICSAENRAGIKSKNFTLYVVSSGTFGVSANLSKVEIAGIIVALLIIFVVLFVVITLILIRSKKFPVYIFKSSSGQPQNDSLEKKKPLAKMLTNGSTIYPNSLPYNAHQQLSMLGLDGIDKKPEIFLKPDLVGSNIQQQQQPQLQIPPNITSSYELNHFSNGQELAFVEDYNCQGALFVNEASQYFSQEHSAQDNSSGLYRAVMVPPSVITNSSTIISAPQTTSTMVSNGASTSPPPIIISNLYNQYLSQYDPNQLSEANNQQLMATPFCSQNQFVSPPPTSLVYGNPGFVPDSMTRLDQFTTTLYSNENRTEDDDEVFRSTVQLEQPLTSNMTATPSPPIPRQSTATNFCNLTSNTQQQQPTLMAESIYGTRRPSSNLNNQYNIPPLQMAPPAPIQHSSIYGMTMTVKNRLNNSAVGTQNNQQFQYHINSTQPNILATSLSNIRYSPDEGYGEESSTGFSVGQLEGTEV